MEPEFRNSAPLIAAGRTLSGTVLAYGDEALVEFRAGLIRERFVPGAFDPVPAVPLVMQHDESMPIARAGEYELRDTPAALEIRATLPEKSAAAHLVRSGALSGYSVKFVPLRESMQAGVRVIEKAALRHVGLVDGGAYPGSVAEVRARGSRGGRLGTIRAAIPGGKVLDCRCGPKGCTKALFETGALDDVLGEDQQRDLLAVWNNYERPLGSKKGGSVRFWNDGKGNMQVAVDIPNTPDGSAFMDTMRADIPLFARPYIDTDASDFVREGPLVRYKRAEVRSINIGATDATSGWTAIKLGKSGEGPPEERRESPRRVRLWL